jgi:hypothetical protein
MYELICDAQYKAKVETTIPSHIRNFKITIGRVKKCDARENTHHTLRIQGG